MFQLFVFSLSIVLALVFVCPLIRAQIDKSSGYNTGHYFQYINVPKHKVYEWGYKLGNKHRFREQYLSQKDHRFKGRVSKESIFFLWSFVLHIIKNYFK